MMTQAKMSTPHALYGKQEKVMLENVSAGAQFRIDVNSIISEFSSVSIESLGSTGINEIFQLHTETNPKIGINIANIHQALNIS